MKDKTQYAEILLFQNVGTGKDTLTYEIPEELKISPGTMVEVHLRNRPVKGVVYRIHGNKPTYRTKPVNKIIEHAPHLKDWQLQLLDWLAAYYFCPRFKVLRLFFPASMVRKKKGLKDIIPDFAENPFTMKFRHELNQAQKQALGKFENTKKEITLLHGITGSGKTEIYMHAVEKALNLKKQVLILIPEISLSPQTQKRFEDHFHEPASVIHSRLTLKQKEEAWIRIAKGQTKIIIGSRSALFAPFENLGSIIIDEEHDHSYKQDQAPRYHAVTVAAEIAKILNIKVLMGSATPSIESYHAAVTGKYEHIFLNERPRKNITLPKTTVIDLRNEILKKNYSIFGSDLRENMEKCLAGGKQSLLFLNRRGAASAVICRVCGFVKKCGHCEIPMTYHKRFSVEGRTFDAQRLICHHCGLTEHVPVSCPACGSSYIKYIGLGTQRVEDELKKIFPAAEVVRADRDTTSQRDGFKKIYEVFSDGKADILVGTQMVAFGLHLPKVNLVGIVLADMGLTLPDFRSSEQTFQLITQVAGRAGRESAGKAIIQTYLPDHYVIKAAARHDYIGFYEQEIQIRKDLNNPPFSKLIKLTVKDKNNLRCLRETEQIVSMLETAGQKTGNPVSINHYPALIPRLNGIYRWHILLNGQSPDQVLKLLPDSALQKLIIDVDPSSTL